MASFVGHVYKNPQVDNLPDQSDYSESCSERSFSSSETDDDFEPAWIEKVGVKGDLFYVEPAVAVEAHAIDVDQEKPLYSTMNLLVTDPKVNTTEKLKQWMKHRRKKIKHHLPESRLTIDGSSAGAPKVTFKTSPNGEVKELLLDVDPRRHNYGRRATLSERLFGIAVSPFSYPPQESSTQDPRIMICGLTPDGEAYREGTIKIGDWLKSVDDIEVTFDNLNSVLGNIISSRKVKLTVQRFAGHSSSPNVQSQDNLNSCSLIKQLGGDPDALEKLKSDYLQIPHALFYLNVCNETSQDEEDVLYQYPDLDTPLLKQKGMFITLGHMISDVASPPLLSCSLIVEEEIVHVGFVMEGKQIMVIALPLSCATVFEVQHFATDIAKLLKLQFSTLSKAFGEAGNREYLDHFFILFFHHLLSPMMDMHLKSSPPHLLSILPSIHWFPLPPDLKIQIDDILCQFESADFGDMSEGYYGIRRMYNILGSCLFYKGYLLGSHLHKDDLLDIHLYLQYHRMLSLNKTHPVSQAIIWKEIYPSRRQDCRAAIEPGYEEADGRWFFLAVAMRYSILALILEAGGCALRVTGYPSPEPFYVDQVHSTLLLFENSNIFPVVDKLLETQAPSLASPDSFLKEEKSSWNILSSLIGRNPVSPSSPSIQSNHLLSQRSLSYSSLALEGASNKKIAEVSSILKKPSDADLERQQLLSNMGPADGESDAENNASPAASNETLHQQRYRSHSISTSSNTGSHESEDTLPIQDQTMKRMFASSCDISNIYSSQDLLTDGHQEEATRLLAGCKNTLFHYLHMDPIEGIFLAPTEQAQRWMKGPTAMQVMQSFHHCCLNMRTTFERSLRNKELSVNEVTPKFGLNAFLQAVHEQGALFQYTPGDDGNQKRSQPVLSFWVIGRLFFSPEPREVYVCYHDSAQQNVVELAFRLGFGLSL